MGRKISAPFFCVWSLQVERKVLADNWLLSKCVVVVVACVVVVVVVVFLLSQASGEQLLETTWGMESQNTDVLYKCRHKYRHNHRNDNRSIYKYICRITDKNTIQIQTQRQMQCLPGAWADIGWVKVGGWTARRLPAGRDKHLKTTKCR